MTATMTLLQDNECSIQPLTRGTSPLTMLPMIVGISAPKAPSVQRAVDTHQPHGPSNSHREPATRPPIRTSRPAGLRPRTMASQDLLPR